VFREYVLKTVLTRSIFQPPKTSDIVWWLGSAQTRWESLQCFHNPSWIKGSLFLREGGREGRIIGGEGTGGEGTGEREREGQSPL